MRGLDGKVSYYRLRYKIVWDKWIIPGQFFLNLICSLQLAFNKNYPWLDLNCGSLVSEANPTVPQPLPNITIMFIQYLLFLGMPHLKKYFMRVIYFQGLDNLPVLCSFRSGGHPCLLLRLLGSSRRHSEFPSELGFRGGGLPLHKPPQVTTYQCHHRLLWLN